MSDAFPPATTRQLNTVLERLRQSDPDWVDSIEREIHECLVAWGRAT
jgi:hypothetical protein